MSVRAYTVDRHVSITQVEGSMDDVGLAYLVFLRQADALRYNSNTTKINKI